MELVGENGKPLVEERKEAEPEQEELKLATVLIAMKPDGSLSISGPKDIRLCLQLVNEAHDILVARLGANFTMMRLAEAGSHGPDIARPGLRDVLAINKGAGR